MGSIGQGVTHPKAPSSLGGFLPEGRTRRLALALSAGLDSLLQILSRLREAFFCSRPCCAERERERDQEGGPHLPEVCVCIISSQFHGCLFQNELTHPSEYPTAARRRDRRVGTGRVLDGSLWAWRLPLFCSGLLQDSEVALPPGVAPGCFSGAFENVPQPCVCVGGGIRLCVCVSVFRQKNIISSVGSRQIIATAVLNRCY